MAIRYGKMYIHALDWTCAGKRSERGGGGEGAVNSVRPSKRAMYIALHRWYTVVLFLVAILKVKRYVFFSFGWLDGAGA